MMKKYFAAAAAVMCLLGARAEVFEVDGISYRPVSSDASVCEVTYPVSGVYSGDVALPAEVSFEGETFLIAGVGDYAFAGSENLTSVTLPASVTSVGRNAFQGCVSLTELSFPDAVGEVAEQTFYGCSSLVSFTGKGVVSLGPAAFAGCSSLSVLSLGEVLEYAGDYCFRNCTSLTSFSFGSDSEIGTGVFSGCTALASAVLPEGIEVVPDHFFSNCSALVSVEGVADAVEIGDYAFYACSSLPSLKLGNSLLSVGRYAFGFCSDLELDAICGDAVTIGDFAFTGCGSLRDFAMTGVREIGTEAFANAYGLQSVSFDAEMKYIRDRAFRGCDAIDVVTCLASLPPYLENSSFSEKVYTSATLKVAYGLELLYRQTPPWSYFLAVEEIRDSGLGCPGVDGEAFSAEVRGNVLKVSGQPGRLSVWSVSGSSICSFTKGDGSVEVALPGPGVYVIDLDGKTLKIMSR